MTVREAAGKLGIHVQTVYLLCSRGHLGHSRVGLGRGAIRIAPEQLAAFVRSRTVEPTGPVAERAAERAAETGVRDIMGELMAEQAARAERRMARKDAGAKS